ncbi:hypothetical protein NQ318_009398 [Aromia moschata]|uniref:Uncharacterized protein n=1 Tax=Aromia moschata TaxID=1265417 RepID=A0AAV8Z730_9CUCU|nr:hypothetical protein NQ318_009398 [Aromia moschata]
MVERGEARVPTIKKPTIWFLYGSHYTLALGLSRVLSARLLKRRCLFENEEQLNMALNKMQPTNYLESLFYIDALIYFKKTTELLEIFKQGNEVFISKIIKQPWFFKEVFKDVTIEEVVNEFLPCTSFAIRMKVLKKLSITLDENQMDQLFDCVLKRYGLYIASNIVHACSPTKISEVLSNNKIFLRPSQLKYIVNKNSGIFKYYIEYYKTHTNSCYDDENVINYIAIKYPQLMLDLKKDEKLHVSVLGHRTSKRIVDLVKDDIIKDVRKYLKFLKNDVIVRKLGNNFESIYLDLFPKNEKEMNSYDWSNKVLKFYPRRRQWDLLAKTFSHVFNNRNLLENVCPDKNIIHKWAEIKYKEQETDSFLKYFEPSKAITIIKEKINVTSASNSRGNLLELMIDVCEQNDIHFLETVLCYVCFRHRNEEVYIRRSFLNHINFVYKNKMGTFTEKIWQCIYEQLDLLRLTNKYCDIYADYRDFLKKYFEFLIEKSKPIGEFENFIERCITLKRSFLLGLKNPPIEKKFLVKLIELIPNCLDKKNEEKYQFTCKQLIQDLTCFNYIKVLLNKTENLDDDDCIALNSLVCFNHTFPEILKMNDAEMLKILLNIAEVNPYILTDIAKQMY